MSFLFVVGAACGGDGESPPTTAQETTPSTISAIGALHDSIQDGARYQVRGAVDPQQCQVTFGDSFTNTAAQPVTITGATFGQLEGVSTVGMVKLPEGSIGVGNPPGFPPKGDKELRRLWPQVKQLVGSIIQPGETTWVAFGIELKPGVLEGTASALTIDYEVGEARYRASDEDTFTATAWPRKTCPA